MLEKRISHNIDNYIKLERFRLTEIMVDIIISNQSYPPPKLIIALYFL